LELPISTQELASIYRFACLLTSDRAAAEQAVVGAIAECAAQIEGCRNAVTRLACLLAAVRARCAAAHKSLASAPTTAGALSHENENAALLQKIGALPEPERTAIALFYLGILSVRDIASFLKISLEELSGILGRARANLRGDGFASGSHLPVEAAH